MPTLCFVSYEFHPATQGGCGVFVRNATDELIRRGHRVVLLIDCPPAAFAAIRPDAPRRFHPYRVDDVLGRTLAPSEGLSRFERDSARFMLSLDRVLRREPIGLIEFFDFCGPAAAYLSRRAERGGGGPPVAVRAHGTLEVLDRASAPGVMDADRRAAHELERRALSLADYVLVASRPYADEVLRPIYAGLADRALVSRPPVRPLPTVPRRPADPARVACVGKLSRLKGVDQVVEACVALMRRRPDLPFAADLAGAEGDDAPGPMLPLLRAMIPPDLAPRFVFHGHLPLRGVAEILSKAKLCVFASRTESFGYAVHEANATGVAMVLRDLPAYRDFFVDGRDCRVFDGTTPGLAAAIEAEIERGDDRARNTEPPIPLGDFYDSAPARPSAWERSLKAWCRATGRSPRVSTASGEHG